MWGAGPSAKGDARWGARFWEVLLQSNGGSSADRSTTGVVVLLGLLLVQAANAVIILHQLAIYRNLRSTIATLGTH